MKIYIITMEDPVYTNSFFHEIMKVRSNDIIGIAIAKGNRFKIAKDRSKIVYLFTLMVIMGIPFFLENTWKTIYYKTRKKLAECFSFIKSPSLKKMAEHLNIPVCETDNPNSKFFLEFLRSLQPDIIINQSQFILQKELLDIPKSGVLNRHNALLPKNRGRLTPFWVLFKKEKETGVSIHFVDEGIDSGDIIVQERFPVEKNDTFKTIVNKNYRIASAAMLRALDIVEKGNFERIKNNNANSSYNTVPDFKTALIFRLRRLNLLK
ncbi:MAG: methionyl-tRNA formyltransferase [Bacteroidia bacterium]